MPISEEPKISALDEHFPGQDKPEIKEILRYWIAQEAAEMRQCRTVGEFVYLSRVEPPEAKARAMELAERFDNLDKDTQMAITEELIRGLR